MSDSDGVGLEYDFFEQPPRVTDTGAGLTVHNSGEQDVYYIRDPCFKQEIVLERDAMAGTGGLVWPAGRYLARFRVEKRAEELKDKVIVELGSGSGIIGLCIASSIDLGTGTFYITDMAKVVPVMQRNCQINADPVGLKTRELTWGEDTVDPDLQEPDVILMADCIYLESLFEPLVETLKSISNTSTVIYLCYKKRRKADIRFFKLLHKQFTSTLLEQDNQGLYLYRVTRR